MFGLCSGEIWAKFRFGSLSGQICSGQVRFSLGIVRVWVTYKYHVRIDMDSVWVEFGSSLPRILYSNSIQIRHG